MRIAIFRKKLNTYTQLGTYSDKIFRRFLGLFWPIFDSNFGVNINFRILTPKFESKIGSKEPKNRLKLFIEIGSLRGFSKQLPIGISGKPY